MVRTTPPRPPAAPPADAAEGAAHVRAFMLELFARKDGEAVDWNLVAETLFRASFDLLDKLPDDQRRAVARRVHEGSYRRFMASHDVDSAASNSSPARAQSAPSNTDDSKSNGPCPPK